MTLWAWLAAITPSIIDLVRRATARVKSYKEQEKDMYDARP